MPTIHDYASVEELHRSRAVVYRCEGADGRRVVAKCVPLHTSEAAARARLLHERDILKLTQGVGAAAGLPELIECVETEPWLALIVADVGGYSLSVQRAPTPLTLREIVHIGHAVAQTLVILHEASVIHKDINPNNIVYNRQNGAVQLIDFGISSQLAREFQTVDSEQRIEGTLAYLSPEQTGRLNWALDYRSDFYSLGATLYDLLAGRPVFVDADMAGELDVAQRIHRILAEAPVALPTRNPLVPHILAGIIHKLLAKAPEERYQSAFGIAHDLAECLKQLDADGRIAPFALAQADRSERFSIPQRLYGREDELQKMRAGYERTRQAQPTLILLEGASGSGKSALIQQMHPILLADQGLFAAGKFDELRRDVPYLAFGQAIGMLMRQMLAADAAVLARWRRRLAAALGNMGQAVVNIVPTLAQVIGKQPPLAPLPPAETEGRLLAALGRFVHALCAEQTLCLVLDDMQWADSGTLKLLDSLLSENEALSLLVIAAYRDEARQAGHPLQRLQEAAVASPRFAIVNITLGSLARAGVAALVADTVGSQESAPLAELIYDKTSGNAFLVAELLRYLWKNGLLRYAASQGRWTWDLSTVAALPVMGNMVALLTARLAELPAATLDLLGFAACVGDELTLASVRIFKNMQPQHAADVMWPALQAGIILPLGEAYRYTAVAPETIRYKFAHDRLRIACYDRVDKALAMQWHYAIGHAQWAAHAQDSALESDTQWRFEVLNQLNRSLPLVAGEAAQSALAELNLLGGKAAKASVAYVQAKSYLTVAEGLLGSVQNAPELQRAVQLELADSEYLDGDLKTSVARLDRLLGATQDPLEQAIIQTHRAEAFYEGNNLAAAKEAMLRGMELLGLHLPRQPSAARVAWTLLRVWRAIGRADVARLTALPVCTDRRVIELMSLLVSFMPLAVQGFDFNLYALAILETVLLSMRHGKTPSTGFCLATVSTVFLTAFGDVALGRRLRDAGLQLIDPSDALSPARVEATLATFMTHLEVSPAVLAERGPQWFETSMRLGDFQHVAMTVSAGVQFSQAFALDLSAKFLQRGLDVARRRGDAGSVAAMRASLQERACLQGRTDAWGSFNDADYNEAQQLAEIRKRHHGVALISFANAKLRAAIVCRDFVGARTAMDWVGESGLLRLVGKGAASTVTLAIFAILMVTQGATGTPSRWRLRWQLRTWLGHLNWFAKVSPAFYGGLPPWVEAEIAAVTGDTASAMRLYVQALPQIEASGYTSFAALAHECAGRFFARIGVEPAAQAYLLRAVHLYRAWGATAKADELQNSFAALFHGVTQRSGAYVGTGASTITQDIDKQQLDLLAIVKASQAISGEVFQDRLVERLLAAVLSSAGADRAVLWQAEALPDAEPILTLKAAQEAGQSAALQPAAVTTSKLPLRLATYTARSAETVIFDAGDGASWWSDAYFQTAAPKSVLCIPMLQQGRLRGVLYLENRLTPRAFGRDRLVLIEMLAAQAAISLENSELYADLEKKVEERTGQLRAAQAKLLRVQQQATEVQMAGGFAHEMRNALFAANALAQTSQSTDAIETVDTALDAMVNQAMSKLPHADAEAFAAQTQRLIAGIEATREAMDGIAVSTARALRITKQILEYARLGQLAPETSAVRVDHVVQEILTQLEGSLQHNHVQTQVALPADFQIAMKEDHLHAVLNNLIINAVDALSGAAGDAERRIDIRGEKVADVAYLHVTDTGPGIDPAIVPRLFQPFASTKGQGGAGLGLGMVRRIVELYGGAVQVDDAKAGGAQFTFSCRSKRLTRPAIDCRAARC